MIFNVFVKEGENLIHNERLFHALIYEILRCKDVFDKIEMLCRNLSKVSSQLTSRVKLFLEGPIQRMLRDLLPKVEHYFEKESYMSTQDVMNLISGHHEFSDPTYPYPWTCAAYYVENPKERKFFESYHRQSLSKYRVWFI